MSKRYPARTNAVLKAVRRNPKAFRRALGLSHQSRARGNMLDWFEQQKVEAHERMFTFEEVLNRPCHRGSGVASSAEAVVDGQQQLPATDLTETECQHAVPSCLMRAQAWLLKRWHQTLQRAAVSCPSKAANLSKLISFFNHARTKSGKIKNEITNLNVNR